MTGMAYYSVYFEQLGTQAYPNLQLIRFFLGGWSWSDHHEKLPSLMIGRLYRNQRWVKHSVTSTIQSTKAGTN